MDRSDTFEDCDPDLHARNELLSRAEVDLTPVSEYDEPRRAPSNVSDDTSQQHAMPPSNANLHPNGRDQVSEERGRHQSRQRPSNSRPPTVSDDVRPHTAPPSNANFQYQNGRDQVSEERRRARDQPHQGTSDSPSRQSTDVRPNVSDDVRLHMASHNIANADQDGRYQGSEEDQPDSSQFDTRSHPRRHQQEHSSENLAEDHHPYQPDGRQLRPQDFEEIVRYRLEEAVRDLSATLPYVCRQDVCRLLQGEQQHQEPDYARDPFVGDVQPGLGIPHPGLGVPLPGFAYDQPGFAFHQPGFGIPHPAFAFHLPGFGVPQPAFGVHQPGFGIPPANVVFSHGFPAPPHAFPFVLQPGPPGFLQVGPGVAQAGPGIPLVGPPIDAGVPSFVVPAPPEDADEFDFGSDDEMLTSNFHGPRTSTPVRGQEARNDVEDPQGNPPPRFKTQLCIEFAVTGNCPCHVQCRFIHITKKGLPVWEYEKRVHSGLMDRTETFEDCDPDHKLRASVCQTAYKQYCEMISRAEFDLSNDSESDQSGREPSSSRCNVSGDVRLHITPPNIANVNQNGRDHDSEERRRVRDDRRRDETSSRYASQQIRRPRQHDTSQETSQYADSVDARRPRDRRRSEEEDLQDESTSSRSDTRSHARLLQHGHDHSRHLDAQETADAQQSLVRAHREAPKQCRRVPSAFRWRKASPDARDAGAEIRRRYDLLCERLEERYRRVQQAVIELSQDARDERRDALRRPETAQCRSSAANRVRRCALSPRGSAAQRRPADDVLSVRHPPGSSSSSSPTATMSEGAQKRKWSGGEEEARRHAMKRRHVARVTPR